MKIGIFYNTIKSRKLGISYDLLKSWHDCLVSLGEDVAIYDGKNYKTDCDVAVVFGYGYHGSSGKQVARYNIINHQKSQNRFTICFDSPLFSNVGNKKYFKIGLHSPMNNGIFLNKNSPPNRWKMLQDEFNISCLPWKNHGEYILICLQPTDNWSMGGVDAIKWASDSIQQIEKYSNQPIIVRSHPNKPNDAKVVQVLHPNVEVSPTNRTDLINVLNKASRLIIYNSNIGSDAVVCGVPVFASENKCMAWDMSNKDLSNINNPQFPDRTQWLNDMGYAMWSQNEIRSGVVWARFRKFFENEISRL